MTSGPRPARRSRPVTIADVARHAGVSMSTVSYVLSGKRAISAGTRSRVLASVRELGYQPHAGARALASHRTRMLALALPLRAEADQPVVLHFAAAVVAAAREAGHDVLLLPLDEGPDGLHRIAASAMVDGLILLLPPSDPGSPSDARPPVSPEPPASPEPPPSSPEPPASPEPPPSSPEPPSPGAGLYASEIGLPSVLVRLPATPGRAETEGRRAIRLLLDRPV
ncbi:LacI family DNA-binding transcriptional regulator [Actinoplanes sp. NPDC051411]|uniref:LacI family DNA-binding transcriptional regulator n=1 Tax=Actinoplanes sp. NPDC051411 TaxID=3155522 RepID=UPI0034209F6E